MEFVTESASITVTAAARRNAHAKNARHGKSPLRTGVLVQQATLSRADADAAGARERTLFEGARCVPRVAEPARAALARVIPVDASASACRVTTPARPPASTLSPLSQALHAQAQAIGGETPQRGKQH